MNSQRGSSRRGRGTSSSDRGRGSYYNRSNGAISRNSSFRAQRQPSVTPSTVSRLSTPNQFNNSRQPSSAPSVVYRQSPASVTPSQPRDNFDDGASDEALDEIVMAVDMNPRGTVGCAYYVAAQEKLYFMEDIELGGPDVIEARKFRRRLQSYASLTMSSQNFHRSYRHSCVIQTRRYSARQA
jgi:DNA mismatch repair protein MSH5